MALPDFTSNASTSSPGVHDAGAQSAAVGSAVGADNRALAARVLQFLEARRRSRTGELPAFACHADGRESELFGLLDHAAGRYIVGAAAPNADDPDVDDAGAWAALADAVIAAQAEDGWFRSGDAQGHHPLHVTAYALGVLALAERRGARTPFARLRPISGFPEMAYAALLGPEALSLLDRIHFWRGSHKAGGTAAIVGQCHQAGAAANLLGIDDADAWLATWAECWDRAAGADGLWRFGSPLRELFYIPYSWRRHREAYAVIGGAAHIYWIHHRLGRNVGAPSAMADYILAHAGDRAICEDTPYCLDFDRLCLLEQALPHLGDGAQAQAVRDLIQRSSAAIRAYCLGQPPSAWFASSHRLPGALAAIAVGERVAAIEARRAPDPPLRDLLATAWWL